MDAVVRLWGNSAAVRIPAKALLDAGLALDQPVNIRVDGSRLVIEAAEPRHDLNDLIAGITAANRHVVVDFGPPEGSETW